MPARVDLLDREQRKRDEMFQMQLRQQNQALQGSPVDPAATMRPRQQLYQPQETPTQLESQYRRRGPSTAAQAILSGRSPTAGTALLKTIAAGFAGHQQRKGEKARETKLAKAIERQEQIVSAAESKVIEADMGDMVPSGMRGKMGYADISTADMEAMRNPNAERDAAIEKADQADKDAIAAANTLNTIENREATAARADAANLATEQDRSAKNKIAEERNRIAEITANKSGSAAFRPSSTERVKYNEAHGLERKFSRANSLLDDMTPEQIEGLARPIPDVVLETFAPSGIKRWMEENSLYDDPQQLNYRTQVAKIESNFSKLMSGSAVSVYEMSDRKNWSPYADGISQEERQRRMDNLQEEVRDSIGIYNDSYPDFAKPNPWEEEVTQDRPPQVQGPQQQQPQGAFANARQQVGNVVEDFQQQMNQQAPPQAVPMTQADFDALPIGAEYIDPDDGLTYRK